ncbi:MAG: sugar phosphate isomerase/epimerase [Candidatus Omnitrophica bacterium]|nr:sugar phosphate isomerase/epimerase [Candidatus Omnitrophota bacterium]
MKNVLQINYWVLGGFENIKPVEEALKEVKEMGLDGLELCFSGGQFGPGITRERCLQIGQAAKELGLKIETLASGVFWSQSLSHPDTSVRKKAISFAKEYLQVAAWVGAKVVLVVPGAVAVPWDSSQPVVPYQTVWKNATASLRQLLPLARKLKVTIGLENVWNWFLTDPVSLRTFVDQFKSKWIGVYFDVANCLINGYPEHWIEILGNRIKAIHIKNFSRADCGGTLHGFGDDLLKGEVNFEAVKAALKKTKYTGPLTAEMIPFCRLPNLTLPDISLAKDTAAKLIQLFRS